MPNWVFNHLAVEGDSKDLDVVKAQLNSPFSKNHMMWDTKTQTYETTTTTYSNPVFSFWNIIRPTDLDTYYLQEDPNEDKSKIWSGNNWYHWNIRNWGTKWDVAISDNDEGYQETSIDESDGIDTYPHVWHQGHKQQSQNCRWCKGYKRLQYRFDTAWSPPIPAIEKLSAQHPNLTFRLSYEEEQGWGGEIHLVNGEEKYSMEYDDKCLECDATNNMDYCEDCGCNVCLSCKATRDEGMCDHDSN